MPTRETSRPLPRLCVDAPLAAGAILTLPPAHSHYLVTVLRAAVGDGVLLFDGRDSGEWLAHVSAAHRKHAQLTLAHQSRPPEQPVDLWLAFAPIKRGRIDWIAEKACELGIAALQPVTTRRTIAQRLAADRLQRTMEEAAEQCGRTRVPALRATVTLERLMADWPAERRLYFADEDAGGGRDESPIRPLPDALASLPAGAPAALLVGPEGGFTPEERALLRSHAACEPVGLGPRILRADTACIAALAVFQALRGDWSALPRWSDDAALS